ncbi:MAG: hypothetical protein E4H03_10020 [Myxococcales bacterium]|jgi:hypothetical protein|nr:MAG: hypothetical protein E4H03_10020 [Myxococcales bacterium]
MQQNRNLARGDDLWLWPGERGTQRDIERDKTACAQRAAKNSDGSEAEQVKSVMKCMTNRGWLLDQRAWQARVDKWNREHGG